MVSGEPLVERLSPRETTADDVDSRFDKVSRTASFADVDEGNADLHDPAHDCAAVLCVRIEVYSGSEVAVMYADDPHGDELLLRRPSQSTGEPSGSRVLQGRSRSGMQDPRHR